jgi:hypothetical protein
MRKREERREDSARSDDTEGLVAGTRDSVRRDRDTASLGGKRKNMLLKVGFLLTEDFVSHLI